MSTAPDTLPLAVDFPARAQSPGWQADPAMIGMPVRYCGLIYVIEGVSYTGSYTIVRFVAERRVWQRMWIQPDPWDKHPARRWEVVGQWHHKRLRRAIINAERLHHHLDDRSKTARAWRRAQGYRNVLRRFFRRIQRRIA